MSEPLTRAVFHDSFCQMGGAERVAEQLHRALSEDAPTALHSTVAVPHVLTPYLQKIKIESTWMRFLPLPSKLFRAYFLLYPLAVDHADLTQYDLIVSSCFGYAKGVRRADRKIRPNALHICYCHTPMRWVWRSKDYLSRQSKARLKSWILPLPLKILRRWELKAARQPDFFLANSKVVANRLREAFGVEATVVPPPVDTRRFSPPLGELAPVVEGPDATYLVISRMVSYKRLDVAILGCIALGRRLVVIGDGPDRSRLERLAAGHPNISFLGRASDAVVAEHARRCGALLFPGEEDFGITPLEVNAAGRPVVAFRGGGATETIVEGLNGVFFGQQTPESMAEAILRLEALSWNPEAIRKHAGQFDSAIFRERIRSFVAWAQATVVAPAQVERAEGVALGTSGRNMLINMRLAQQEGSQTDRDCGISVS